LSDSGTQELKKYAKVTKTRQMAMRRHVSTNLNQSKRKRLVVAITLNTNALALTAQRHLQQNTNALATSMARLSSGLRVNSAKDDPAGLAIAQRMTSDLRGMNVARRNVMDVMSMYQTAEGALGRITDMYQRIRELSVQASNGALTAPDRAALQLEAMQLAYQINQTAEKTQFNGIHLLDGSFTGLDIQAGSGSVDKIYSVAIPDIRLKESDATTLTLNGAFMGALWDYDRSNSYRRAYYTGAGAGSVRGLISTDAGVVPARGPQQSSNNDWSINALYFSQSLYDKQFNFSDNDIGLTSIVGTGLELSGLKIPGRVSLDMTFADSKVYEADILNVNDLSPLANAIEQDPNHPFRTQVDPNNGSLKIFVDGNAAGVEVYVRNFRSEISGNQVTVRAIDFETGDPIGAREGGLNQFALRSDAPIRTDDAFDAVVTGMVKLTSSRGPISWEVTSSPQIPGINGPLIFPSDSGTTAVPILGIDLTTAETARSTMSAVDAQLEKVLGARGALGAQINRMAAVDSQLSVSVESATSARGRIIDADYATEQSAVVRANILQQAGTAVLAQANSHPSVVLTLLKGL
jgi:flagellin